MFYHVKIACYQILTPQLEYFIALNENYMLMWKTHRIMAWKQ